VRVEVSAGKDIAAGGGFSRIRRATQGLFNMIIEARP
jgi:hypothetical protein